MRWRLRVDVVEGEDPIVLVNDRPGDLPIDDFAEETVGHCKSPRRMTEDPEDRTWRAYLRSTTAVRAMPCRSRRSSHRLRSSVLAINCSIRSSCPRPNSN